MPVEIVMPRMGLTMEEGTVTAWLKRAGQSVRAGEPLLEIETDKTTVEIEATASGILAADVAPIGTVAPVGAVVGHLLAPGEAAAQPAAPLPQAEPPASQAGLPTSTASRTAPVRASPAARRQAHKLGMALAEVQGTGPAGRIVARNVLEAAALAAPKPAGKASPLAQRVAADLGVDLNQVTGSGLSGRVTRRDVEHAAARPQAAAAEVPAPAEEIQPLSRAQRLAAERVAASFAGAPHFYMHAEVDARPLVALRSGLQPRLKERADVRLTFTDLLVKFCALTLAHHPRLLAEWTQAGLRQHHGVHIGVAVDTAQGLVVPVIRDADRLGLVEIARCRADLSERARAGKLQPQDLELGVFTLTNLGMFKVDAFDAILNPPQAAILAVGQLKERPLAEKGTLIAAPTLKLSLSLDHRVVDGATGARFLSELVDLLETPGLALA
jgi:pyruvate dehydrogenase E2 component (dihydrolipoamide acetyltransferase)